MTFSGGDSYVSIGAALKVGQTWAVRRGMSHGLKQPGVAISVQVRTEGAAELRRTLQLLVALQCGDMPEPADGDTPPQLLVRTLVEALIGLQRELGLAVHDAFHVAPAADDAPQHGWKPFLVIMPTPLHGVLSGMVRWLVENFGTLDSGSIVDTKDLFLRSVRPLVPQSVNRELIRAAALHRAIPNFEIAPGFMVLGLGRRSRWLRSTESHATSAIGVRVAASKSLTASILRTYGLPGATHRLVQSAEDAERAADMIGYPVVVKPDDLERGTGVAADLRDGAAVRQAFEQARQHSQRVLVERFCPGFTHRITIFNGKIVRISKRIAGGVVGDGRSSIRELVDTAPLRPLHLAILQRTGSRPLTLDGEALVMLQGEGLTPDDVLPAGRYVRLRRRDNVNAGGTNEIVPIAQAHPDNIELAMTVAELLGLDFAGIDMITADIALPWREVPSLICEVNSTPQLGVTDVPDTYLRLMDDMFPDGAAIPTKLVIVPERPELRVREGQRRGSTDTGHGLSDASGLYVAGRHVSRPFADGYFAAQALLTRPDVSHATCLMSAREVCRHGTPLVSWDSIEVAAAAFDLTEQPALTIAMQILRHHTQSLTAPRRRLDEPLLENTNSGNG